MTTKADDVLHLSTARTLLGCASGQSLVDGVRALRAQVAEAEVVARALRAERDELRDLLIEEQKLRHDYGTRLAKAEAEAQRVPTVVAVSEGPRFVVVDTEGGGTWVP